MRTQRKGPITRESILGTIEFNLDSVDHWKELELWHRAAEYSSRAETLIELLEVSDCGSAGGYAKGQTQAHRRNLWARLNWLRKA